MHELSKGCVVVLLGAALAACETQPTKQQVGAVAGGVLGGVLGAQVGEGRGSTLAIVAGTLFGAYLGSRVGKSMDASDQTKAARALETAPTGAPTAWRNPDTGNTYTVTPTKTYETASGPCRNFTTRAIIEGREEIVHGTACRQPDGNWKAQ